MRRFRVPPEPRHWHARFLEGQTSTKLMDFDNFVCLFFQLSRLYCFVTLSIRMKISQESVTSALTWRTREVTNLKCCNVVDMLTWWHDKLTHVDVRWKPCARRSDSWRWSNEPSQSPKNRNEQRATYKLVTGWRNRRAHFVVVFFCSICLSFVQVWVFGMFRPCVQAQGCVSAACSTEEDALLHFPPRMATGQQVAHFSMFWSCLVEANVGECFCLFTCLRT